MAIKKVSKNVRIDADKKIVYCVLSKLTADEKTLVQLQVAGGFTIEPFKRTSKHNKAYYENLMKKDENALNDFQELCKGSGKGKGYFAAVIYAENWLKEQKAKETAEQPKAK